MWSLSSTCLFIKSRMIQYSPKRSCPLKSNPIERRNSSEKPTKKKMSLENPHYHRAQKSLVPNFNLSLMRRIIPSIHSSIMVKVGGSRIFPTQRPLAGAASHSSLDEWDRCMYRWIPGRQQIWLVGQTEADTWFHGHAITSFRSNRWRPGGGPPRSWTRPAAGGGASFVELEPV